MITDYLNKQRKEYITKVSDKFKYENGVCISPDGKVVISIDENAESIIIPYGVEYIHEDALSKYNEDAFGVRAKMRSLHIPSSLKIIPPAMFSHLNLEHIEFEPAKNSSEQTVLSTKAFAANNNLRKLNIPANYTISDTFTDCINLKSLVYSGRQVGDLAFNCCENLKDVTLPNVEVIGVNAFGHCDIRSLNFPKSLKKICLYAFLCNENLETVKFKAGNSIHISDDVFSDCVKLTYVENLESAKVIGSRAFANTNINHLSLGKNIEMIGLFAFANCKNLTSVRIDMGDGVIPVSCFEDCTNLDIVLLDSIKNVGLMAFRNTGVIDVSFPSNTENLSEGIFNDNKNIMREIDLSDTKITTFSENTFANIIELLVMPKKLKDIEDYAFSSSRIIDLVLYTNNLNFENININRIFEYANIENLILVGNNITKELLEEMLYCDGHIKNIYVNLKDDEKINNIDGTYIYEIKDCIFRFPFKKCNKLFQEER